MAIATQLCGMEGLTASLREALWEWSGNSDGGANVRSGSSAMSLSYPHNPLYSSSNALWPDVHNAHQILLPKSTMKRHHVQKACLTWWLNG